MASLNGGPKENANPTLYATTDANRRRERRVRDSSVLGTRAVSRFNFGTSSTSGCSPTCNHDNDVEESASGAPFNNNTPAAAAAVAAPFSGKGVSWGKIGKGSWERSIHLALTACGSSAGGNNNVSLLRNAGFDIPTDVSSEAACPELREATFVPSPPSVQSVQSTSGGNGQDGGDGDGDGLVSHSRRRDAIDSEYVFEIIRNIQDPEHPNSLEELGVVKLAHVMVVDLKSSSEGDVSSNDSENKKQKQNGGGGNKSLSKVDVSFTPTIPHCSMATLIGLCLRVKLLRSLPSRFKVMVRIEPGTHASETAVNRQLDDKERVRAALENEHLRGVVDRCIGQGMASN